MQATPFPALVITHVYYRAFDCDSEFSVPNRIYGFGPERVQTIEEALEVVFRQCNHVDGTELISQPEYRALRLRSMSVGDQVHIRGLGFNRTYVCEGCGWRETKLSAAINARFASLGL
jgi:hypothetical protein